MPTPLQPISDPFLSRLTVLLAAVFWLTRIQAREKRENPLPAAGLVDPKALVFPERTLLDGVVADLTLLQRAYWHARLLACPGERTAAHESGEDRRRKARLWKTASKHLVGWSDRC